jgi:hypothetical protein
MDEQTRAFLVRIVNTLSWVLLWMFSNLVAGIYYGYGFFNVRPELGNYIFYLYFVGSFLLLLWKLKKSWKI